MNETLRHRGIRSSYKKLNDNDLYLGHTRLPIQGVDKRYDQPSVYGNYTAAMVGELFNFRAMDPSARTDLSVLMDQYSMNGSNVFMNFDGFWSVIIYNEFTGYTDIFTDHLAKKPLYYRTDLCAFASEIKALTVLGENTFDKTYFSAVAKWGYCPEDRTPFSEIKKLPGGAHIQLNSMGYVINSKSYLSLLPSPSASLELIMEDAVRNRLVSDVPVSLLMSGGLDSTIIYYLMRKHTDSMTIFHIDNDEAEYLNYIDFRPQDKLISLSIDDTLYDTDEVLWHNDGPVDLGSLMPQYLLAKEIKKHGFNVCLSGDGADELFGGYKRITEYDSQYSDIFHELAYYHLPRLDKMMMAHTIELRSPFLAHYVIEHALSMKYEDRINKIGLKEAFKHIVPEEIVNRKKKPLRYRTDWRHDLIKQYKDLIIKRGLV